MKIFTKRNKQIQKQELQLIINDFATARIVCEMVAYTMGINEDLLTEGRGSQQHAFARQISMYLMHTGFGLSLSRVASAFARDRSTVSYACHYIEDKRDSEEFERFIIELENIIKNVSEIQKYSLAS